MDGWLARPAVLGDAPALASLAERFETRWFGTPDSDDAEAHQDLARVGDLATHSAVLVVGDGVIAAMTVWGRAETQLWIDPSLDERLTRAAYDYLLSWSATAGAGLVAALRQDKLLLAALADHGWQPKVSGFELTRSVADLPAPSWPAGISDTSIDVDRHGHAVYELIYARARWGDVPGHLVRPYDEWLQILAYDAGQQILAWRGDRPVGVVIGRVFGGGVGWVQQLAVDTGERGRGSTGTSSSYQTSAKCRSSTPSTPSPTRSSTS